MADSDIDQIREIVALLFGHGRPVVIARASLVESANWRAIARGALCEALGGGLVTGFAERSGIQYKAPGLADRPVTRTLSA